jgi:hypothetical protein
MVDRCQTLAAVWLARVCVERHVINLAYVKKGRTAPTLPSASSFHSALSRSRRVENRATTVAARFDELARAHHRTPACQTTSVALP